MIKGYAVVDDERGTVATFATYAEARAMTRKHKPRCAHCRMVREYRAARRAYESQRESVALGYETEEAMYAVENGTLTFKAWLQGMAQEQYA